MPAHPPQLTQFVAHVYFISWIFFAAVRDNTDNRACLACVHAQAAYPFGKIMILDIKIVALRKSGKNYRRVIRIFSTCIRTNERSKYKTKIDVYIVPLTIGAVELVSSLFG